MGLVVVGGVSGLVARLDRSLAAVLRDRAVDGVADVDEELLDRLGLVVVEDVTVIVFVFSPGANESVPVRAA